MYRIALLLILTVAFVGCSTTSKHDPNNATIPFGRFEFQQGPPPVFPDVPPPSR